VPAVRHFLFLLLVANPVLAADLKVGFGTADITPPAGYRMAGGYSEVFATGVNDPLFAKAIYFEQGEVRAALVVCDVCGQARDLTDRIRAAASKAHGIPVDRIAVTATHTHGGPMHYDPVFRDLFGPDQKIPDGGDGKAIRGYRDRFVERCVDAVSAAVKAAKPAALGVDEATVPGVAFNRRYQMKAGPVRCNPGKLNPDVVKAAGPVDERLPILMVSDTATDKPVGSLVSFAMHTAVYGGTTFGADYPGHLQTNLREKYGREFVSVFGEGCAGDVNHIDVSKKERDFTPGEIGAKLASAVTDAKPSATTPALKAAAGVAKVRLRDDQPKRIARSRDLLSGEASKKAAFLDQVEAYQILLSKHLRELHGDAVPLDILAIRLSADAAVVTLPHEVFVEIGMDVRKRSPFKHTFILTIANEVDCYVPTKKAFAEGSYEVTNCPYQPGVGEALADEAVRLLKSLK
jgi:neutral ceramidase